MLVKALCNCVLRQALVLHPRPWSKEKEKRLGIDEQTINVFTHFPPIASTVSLIHIRWSYTVNLYLPTL